MYTKDIERVARGFIAQKLDVAYIRHYLIETYQLDAKTVELVLERVGVKPLVGPKGPGRAPDKPAAEKAKVSKQSFY